jgi:hypothetical protein
MTAKLLITNVNQFTAVSLRPIKEVMGRNLIDRSLECQVGADFFADCNIEVQRGQIAAAR